ncbi:MAG: NAD(P)/FAD-dependent oxidoreductase [Chthoniobacteraceae bacterium]
MESIYDVAIIGGGPAGSTAATFLARNGHKVIVLEKEKFPRFHIGESLLPYSMGAFERLGVREKLDARFLPKYGAEISSTCGTHIAKFYFRDGFRTPPPQAYQVTRSEFDKILLDHSAENGAEVREETSVENLVFGENEVGITVKNAGQTQQISARYIIDCSGRSSVIGTYFKLRQNYANLKKFSVFAHYENVARDDGSDGTFIRIIRGVSYWFWMIPLTATKMSIGIVMDIADFKALKKSPEAMLEESLREQPMVWNRMGNATRVTEVYSVSDYSYRNTSLYGDRWLLAGDAAGFIDPVFSTGVFLAIRSGEAAADAIGAVLKKPASRPAVFKKYQAGVNRVMDLYLRFVSNWYQPQFGDVITNPVNHLQLAPVVNAVLGGNLGSDFSIWWRMQIFYLVVFLQKYVALCPRLSWNPRDCPPTTGLATTSAPAAPAAPRATETTAAI